MVKQNSDSPKLWIVIVTIYAVFFIILSVIHILVYSKGGKEDLSGWGPILLFILPVFLMAVFIYKAHNQIHLTVWLFLIMCPVTHWIFWILYIFSASSTAPWLFTISIICFTLGSGFFILTFICTWLVMNKGRKLSMAVREHPFSSLCAFLGLFLYVTYMLGFSLAFHDKAERGKSNREKTQQNNKKQNNTDKTFALYARLFMA